jgi:hypothetical protein
VGRILLSGAVDVALDFDFTVLREWFGFKKKNINTESNATTRATPTPRTTAPDRSVRPTPSETMHPFTKTIQPKVRSRAEICLSLASEFGIRQVLRLTLR